MTWKKNTTIKQNVSLRHLNYFKYFKYRVWNHKQRFLEAATKGVLCKKAFLEISQNLQKSTCARVSFFNKVVRLSCCPMLLKACILLKKDSGIGAFHFWKILRTFFFNRTPRATAFAATWTVNVASLCKTTIIN